MQLRSSGVLQQPEFREVFNAWTYYRHIKGVSMNYLHKRWFGIAPLFDPTEGITLLEPLNSGPGWWVGAPSVLYDDHRRKF